ncbi:hypothetical protein FRC07_000442 [Ceratobasidium sp. 392]|nr:hypothetical protein FRC07_000442 [Ceratobasidium sp. 392]
MTDRTYAKLLKTTSMSVSDWRELNERKKMLKKGIIPPPEPLKAKTPGRSGLRPKKLTFPRGEAPQILDPTKKKAKETQALQIQIPVPRLAGQADIPGSGSPKCEDHDLAAGYTLLAANLAGPSAPNTTSVTLPAATGANDRDKTRSPEIQDDEDESSNSDQDGEGEDDSDDSDHGDKAGKGSRVQMATLGNHVVTGTLPAIAPLPPTFAMYPPGSAANLQTPHRFGPTSGPIAPAFMDIPADVQDLLLNAPIPLMDDSMPGDDLMPGLAFYDWNPQATTPATFEFYDAVLPAATGFTSGGELGFAPPFAAPPPSVELPSQLNNIANPTVSMGGHTPVASNLPPSTPIPGPQHTPSPLVCPSLQVGALVTNSSSGMCARIPPRASTVTPRAPYQLPRTPTNTNPASCAGTFLAAAQSAPAIRPSTPFRATSAVAPKPRAGSISSHPCRPLAPRLHSSPALRATVSRALPSGPSPGYRLTANPAATGSPAKPRSASPRLSAPSTPLGRSSSLYPLPRLCATRSLGSVSRAGSLLPSCVGSPAPTTPHTEAENNFPSTPHTEIDHDLPLTPRTETGIDDDSFTLGAETEHRLISSGQIDSDIPLAHDHDPASSPPSPLVHGDKDSAGQSEDGVANPSQVPRLCTPPPLSHVLRWNFVTPAPDDIEGSGELDPVPGPVPNWVFMLEPVPSATIAAPTTAEFALARAWEIINLQGKNVAKANPTTGRIKGANKVGTYDVEGKKLLNVMRGSMQHQYTTVSPWLIPEDTLFRRAKQFAKDYSNLPVDEIADVEFQKSFGRLQFSPSGSSFKEPSASKRVTSHRLTGSKHATAACIPGTTWWVVLFLVAVRVDASIKPSVIQQETEDQFDTGLMGEVLVAMYFHLVRRIGIFSMDEILKPDDPNAVAWLLESVALLDARCIPQIPKIVDQSPEASRGPSLAAIAFAAIHIQHALEHLKIPHGAGNGGKKTDVDGNIKKEFSEGSYLETWKGYVRRLAAHRRLGELRSTFLEALKCSTVAWYPVRENLLE